MSNSTQLGVSVSIFFFNEAHDLSLNHVTKGGLGNKSEDQGHIVMQTFWGSLEAL